MKPRIIFFDIDGTILPIGERAVHAPVVEALTAVHDRGVKLFIATGRAPYTLPYLSGIPFDGAICFNGAYCYDDSGLIHAEPMPREDIGTVIRNAEALGCPFTVATSTRYHSEVPAEGADPVLQLTVRTVEAHDALLVKGAPHVKTARWWHRAVDIVPAHWGKAQGIAKVIAHYGIPLEATMAFGDSGNDADMLAYAGTGVALGNATDAAKQAADHVTDTCENDGVVAALRHFGVL